MRSKKYKGFTLPDYFLGVDCRVRGLDDMDSWGHLGIPLRKVSDKTLELWGGTSFMDRAAMIEPDIARADKRGWICPGCGWEGVGNACPVCPWEDPDREWSIEGVQDGFEIADKPVLPRRRRRSVGKR